MEDTKFDLNDFAINLRGTQEAIMTLLTDLATRFKEVYSPEPKYTPVKKGEAFFSVDFDYNQGVIVQVNTEPTDGDREYEDLLFENNNYFDTFQKAQKTAEDFNLYLWLQRQHDIYCPYYRPHWTNKTEDKYFVAYDYNNHTYYSGKTISCEHATSVYFSTKEIADKICEELNSGLFGFDRSKKDKTEKE